MTAAQPVVCDECGRPPGADEVVGAAGVPWTWSLGAADDPSSDQPVRLCSDCARTHARSIEAKLDAEWW